MSGFTLDTSGQIDTPRAPIQIGGKLVNFVIWGDLSPFAQGYVEALFADYQARVHGDANAGLAFSDLAPEALALILRDCERFKADGYGFADDDATDGRLFWSTRQAREWTDVGFPPLTPHLGDDGKVYLREASRG